jgi:dTDP-4-amino-4,6-dideoxygalactose transaminase
MNDKLIRFNKPCSEGKELIYMTQAIRNGHISGDGPYTKYCHEFFEKHLSVSKAFLTTSCTHALEMAALLLGLQPGDEVIIPSFTFVSTANAFALHGAKIVFADIRPDTLNIDEAQLEKLITARTRAVVPVHYAGVGCEMDAIMEIANRRNLMVIEDNAHGLFGKYKDRHLGTFGQMSTLSFHETKNFTCGEGGALLLNDPSYSQRAEIIREKGTNRSRLFRGEIDKYTWVDVGSSYLMSDMLAGFLYAQLEEKDRIQNSRRRIWNHYRKNLEDWAQKNKVGLPYIPGHCEQAFHMFYMLMPSSGSRNALIDHLKSNHIKAVFHYLPLHLSEMGLQMGGENCHCPTSEDISGRLIRLPFYNALSSEKQDLIIDAIHTFDGWT